jgi:predicted dienelactone hydrolase
VTLADSDEAGRTVPVDLWYPADPALRGRDLAEGGAAEHPFGRPHLALPDAPAAPGQFPLLAFSHGNSGLRRQSTFLTTHLASWGFVVVAPDHTGNTFFEMAGLDDDARREAHLAARRCRPRDLSLAIELALEAGPGGPRVDASRLGVLGHSFGGWSACKMPARDSRVRAVCGLAPASEPFVGRKAFEPGELPFPADVASLIVAGIDDVLVDLETSVRPLAARMSAPVRLLGIEGADHFHFCDGVELLHGMHLENPRANQPRPTRPLSELLPEERIHRVLCGLVTRFFAAALDGSSDPLKQLSAEPLAALDRSIRLLA